jgi:ribosomal protein S10
MKLILYSKNKKALNKAFLTFFEYISIKNLLDKKYTQKKTNTHFISILKSPHVNKKAQEQFDFKFFSKELKTHSYLKSFKYLVVSKKIKNNLLSDVNCKIKFSLNNKNKNLKIFNLNNYKLNITDNNNMSQSRNLKDIKLSKFFDNKMNKKTKQLLKILDLYGELENLKIKFG